MRRLLAALVLGVAATFGGAQAATAPSDPIVGTWSYGGGTVTVRRTGSTFEGIVGRPVRFTQCTHYAGERMWSIVKTPKGYAGRQFSFGAGIGCQGRIWVSANWRLERGALRFWVAKRSGPGELAELAVTGPRQRSAARLVLDVSVRSSTAADCTAGARGTLTLVNGAADEAIVAVCGRTSRYRGGGATSVRVTFTRP